MHEQHPFSVPLYRNFCRRTLHDNARSPRPHSNALPKRASTIAEIRAPSTQAKNRATVRVCCQTTASINAARATLITSIAATTTPAMRRSSNVSLTRHARRFGACAAHLNVLPRQSLILNQQSSQHGGSQFGTSASENRCSSVASMPRGSTSSKSSNQVGFFTKCASPSSLSLFFSRQHALHRHRRQQHAHRGLLASAAASYCHSFLPVGTCCVIWPVKVNKSTKRDTAIAKASGEMKNTALNVGAHTACPARLVWPLGHASHLITPALAANFPPGQALHLGEPSSE